MCGKRFTAFDFAGSGLAETLARGFYRFHLRHILFLSSLFIDSTITQLFILNKLKQKIIQ